MDHTPLLPASYDIVWSIAAIAHLALLAVSLVHLARRKDLGATHGLLWVLVVLFVPLLGPAAYLLVGRAQRRTDS